MWMSVPQIPVRRTLISTSLIPIVGVGMSSSHSPGCACFLTSAFTTQEYMKVNRTGAFSVSALVTVAEESGRRQKHPEHHGLIDLTGLSSLLFRAPLPS